MIERQKRKKYNLAWQNTANNIRGTIPVLLGTILLISLLISYIPKSFYHNFFTGNNIIDSFLGALLGSVATGNPVNSYVLGGEFLKQGVGLIAVIAFMISWVTVGIIQFPAESLLLGKKFALVRNIFGFFSAIIIAILTVLILQFI